MSDFDFVKKIVDAVEDEIQNTLARAGGEIAALLNRRDAFGKVVYLAAFQMTVNALVSKMGQGEKALYDQILANSSTVVMTAPVDRREKEDKA